MNSLSENKYGYVVSAEMKKVRQVQLVLLKKLLEVCEKYNLKIWADGGTLLGTIREHGYIPWDDDIDMGMLREDYDKLTKIAQKEFTHPYFFQDGYTEKNYPAFHAKVRMDGTAGMYMNQQWINVHQGIFIDINPYDAVPDEELDRIEQEKSRDQFLLKRILLINSFDMLHPIRSIFRLATLMKYRKKLWIIYGKFEDVFRKYRIEDCKNVGNLSFKYDTKRLVWDKHCFDKTIYMQFEDIMMPIPVGYQEILTKQYGDYMIPVQAPSEHFFWKLDAERSYKEYLPELKRLCRKEKRKSYNRRIKKAIGYLSTFEKNV